jgi:hypothetical protein
MNQSPATDLSTASRRGFPSISRRIKLSPLPLRPDNDGNGGSTDD